MLVPLSPSLLYSVTLSREDATADPELATSASFLTPFLTRDLLKAHFILKAHRDGLVIIVISNAWCRTLTK